MTLRRAFTVLLLGAAMLLAACGNDDKRLDPKQVAGIIRQGVQDRYNPPPDRDKDALIAAASREALTLAPPEDPLASIRFDSVGIAAVLRRIETNGQHIVWAAWGSSDRKSIISKNGMITATRGLRKDLMSAEADAVLDLVRNLEEGDVPYTLRYLDGDFEIEEAVGERWRVVVVDGAGAAGQDDAAWVELLGGVFELLPGEGGAWDHGREDIIIFEQRCAY